MNPKWQSKWLLKWQTKGKEWYPRLRKWHSRSKGWHQECEYDTKNDTKNGTLTDDLQEFNNDAMNTHDTKNDTKNDTKKKRMKHSVLEANFWNDSMVFNIRELWKRKIRWYTIPMKVLLLSSFVKQKEYVLALLRNSH